MSAPACIDVRSQFEVASAPVPVSVLTVGLADSDYHVLSRHLSGSECCVSRAAGRRDAVREVLRECPDVVICEPDLVDGRWQDLLADVQSLPRSPMLIVCSLLADDRLWAEVLNIGGYDVLMKPFYSDEVNRVIRMAARQVSWKRCRS